MLAVEAGSEVNWEGSEYIQAYSSSEWAERGFCKECGTHFFYRLKHNQQYHIPVALFDDLKELDFNLQIFIDKKPDFYSFTNKTQTMTEADMNALFASGNE